MPWNKTNQTREGTVNFQGRLVVVTATPNKDMPSDFFLSDAKSGREFNLDDYKALTQSQYDFVCKVAQRLCLSTPEARFEIKRAACA